MSEEQENKTNVSTEQKHTHYEKFHVQHTNTGLKDSSIIYMQHLLNENKDSQKT
jgi:hypothetical protein